MKKTRSIVVGIISLIFVFFMKSTMSQTNGSLSRFEALSGKNVLDSKTEWDQKFLSKNYIFGKAPAKFLKENYQIIAKRSVILDMGMGEGRNAVFLATKGHKVIGIDISSVAVDKANALAREFSTEIKGVVGSLDNYPIKNNSFDVILSFYYVDRKLIKKMKKWLKPGGLIFYEAHTLDKLEEGKLINKNYLVEKGEVLNFFKDMKVIKFQEPDDGSYRSSVIVKKSK
mgnify:CR=1 FL=1